MKQTKTLLTSNKYLRNTTVRAQLLASHASASARIEGVRGAKQRLQKIMHKSGILRTA